MPQLVSDGVWTWFHDPRAVWHQDILYLGWSANDGIWIGAFTGAGAEIARFQLRATTSPDDHDVVSIGIRPDGRLLVAYSEHNDTAMRVRISINPGDVSSWGTEQTLTPTVGSVTYPHLFYLSAEDTWYLFYRDFLSPDGFVRYRTSSDHGEAWSAPVQLMADNNERPYTRIDSDGVDRIDVSITDAHPNEITNNNLYHLYYQGGQWRRSDGSAIGTPPFAHANLTKVWDAGDGVSAWNWDVTSGPNPVMVFATFVTTTDHRYQYARFNGTSWDVREIVAAGDAITESPSTEIYYTAGIILDRAQAGGVYLCRAVGATFELEQWTTTDHGTTWTSQALTTGTVAPVKNFRPITARGGGPFQVIWSQGEYNHYTDFAATLQALITVAPVDPGLPAEPVGAARASVTWLACDLVTGRIITELPEIRGSVSRVLGAYTSVGLTMAIPIGGPGAFAANGISHAHLWEQATQPGVTMIVPVVNDVPAAGFIVLDRDGGTDATLNLACVSLEGYLARRYVRDHKWTQQDEAVIFKGLVDDAQTEGIGLVIDAPASGTLRDREYFDKDDATVYSRLEELMGVDGGPEWTIDVVWADAERTTIAKIARVRKRIGLASSAPNAVFSSEGGSNTRYTFKESYTDDKGANHVMATSSGEGEDRPESSEIDDVLPGWPRWERRFSPSSSIKDVGVLNGHAIAELALRRDGAKTWTFQSRWDAYPRLNLDCRLGDDIGWEVTGHRHPFGASGVGRMIGWELDLQAGIFTPILLEVDSDGLG